MINASLRTRMRCVLPWIDQTALIVVSQNQMQDAMTIWDSICHSQWFKSTSIVGHCWVLPVTSAEDLFQDSVLEQGRPFPEENSELWHKDILPGMICGLRNFITSEVHSIQDFDGEARDANSGREYFKKRFARLSQKAGRSKDREIYIQSVPSFVTEHYCWDVISITTATDTALLRVVMAAVEGKIHFRSLSTRRID